MNHQILKNNSIDKIDLKSKQLHHDITDDNCCSIDVNYDTIRKAQLKCSELLLSFGWFKFQKHSLYRLCVHTVIYPLSFDKGGGGVSKIGDDDLLKEAAAALNVLNKQDDVVPTTQNTQNDIMQSEDKIVKDASSVLISRHFQHTNKNNLSQRGGTVTSGTEIGIVEGFRLLKKW
eukprot:CAMPEP_0114334148 /NCGR_PEP_ID=MMETSP0101-20121206/4185_1 /TAXON_ID=38822 ORGANISM="Pteridomonas danica, Strain PT" /NCGR_SAMPLE_ID=MMETSP0101 /ASSEMBLY_ACC=CAM_ASM_000211 /LENGTH=174 /DNA_ID=CAMNT_0001465317 /DNA_START=1106 /DNA_END=1627 /DNA_ORIENTATION=-